MTRPAPSSPAPASASAPSSPATAPASAAAAAAATTRAPERWSTQAADAATATLSIPADARRERRFEIACAVTVNVPADAASPWLQVTVQANGAQQWRRRATAHNPGAWDGLDYRFSRSVPVGQTLRITVNVAGNGVRRRSLIIEADEI